MFPTSQDRLNVPFLSLAVAWSLGMTCGTNLTQPNELVLSLVMFGWVLGNGFWTLFDFAEYRRGPPFLHTNPTTTIQHAAPVTRPVSNRSHLATNI